MSFLETFKQGITTQSAEETQAIAKELAAVLPEECTLALHGDLGTGKTTFIQGLALAWEISKPITSPTFNLYCIYEGTRRLIHMDAYRLEKPEEAEALLLEDFLIPPYCLAIEWPTKLGNTLDANAWHIEFGIQEAGIHTLQLKKI
tara:strand:+ start:10421 stop:10858 length:438 start_codon:yes stop_codon:yes gene_type:complete